MSEHLTRKELVAAARNYSADRTLDHIGECPECREDLLMLVRFMVAGNLPLAEPPESWVERAKGLAKQSSPAAVLKKLVAKLAFDSWAIPEPVGVRGGAAIDQRRVRFEADPVIVDLRAERQRSEWSFVAQVSGIAPGEATLCADKQELALDEYGICQWSHTKPPKRMAVRSKTLTVELPEILWIAKQSKKPPKDS